MAAALKPHHAPQCQRRCGRDKVFLKAPLLLILPVIASISLENQLRGRIDMLIMNQALPDHTVPCNPKHYQNLEKPRDRG